MHPTFQLAVRDSGCRIAEAVGLRWQAVNMETRMIDMSQAMTYYPRREDTYKCEFKVLLPRTEAGKRIIPMMEPVFQALKVEYEGRTRVGFGTTVGRRYDRIYLNK